ncbi:hypothetical protein HDV05_003150 [Chytridiales sp. JEL 0842]|nr:hypothetical protein HDV05_003150 [Chytridiales sp. JEL 0842]
MKFLKRLKDIFGINSTPSTSSDDVRDPQPAAAPKSDDPAAPPSSSQSAALVEDNHTPTRDLNIPTPAQILAEAAAADNEEQEQEQVSDDLKAVHLVDTDLPIAKLEAKKHFDSLEEREKMYAYWIYKASWAGARVVAAEASHDSAKIVQFLLDIFTSAPLKMRDLEALKTKSLVPEESWKFFLEYACVVLAGLSNYSNYGFQKLIPRLPKSHFKAIVAAVESKELLDRFDQLKDSIFAFKDLQFGYPADGQVTGYYDADISETEVKTIQTYLDSHSISTLNTRLFKTGPSAYDLLIASAAIPPREEHHVLPDFKTTLRLKYGDFQNEMAAAARACKEAVPFASNQHEKLMLWKYAESFETGSVEAHMESQKHWIRDVGPVVESNLGFVETYRDPAGVRAEWEGFVAVVNKEMSAKFQRLVDGAESLLAMLPWGPDFEKDVFRRPDFTSLEVVTFATSGIPAGINIPNYDNIRQTIGFKNVSLGNVTNAKVKGEKPPLIRDEDLELFDKWSHDAFEVQVGLHEITGHGSGKILQEEPAGVFNFDIQNPPLNPITNQPVNTWYKPGQTWGSVFGAVASSYEECRAESVAMVLLVHPHVLQIFDITDPKDVDDVIHVAYLLMARSGLAALKVYNPSTKQWGQAHSQARWAITKIFIKTGVATVHVDEQGEGDISVSIDRSKILLEGVPAMCEFLRELHVYKATGDAEKGVQWYKDATVVEEGEEMRWRDLVLKKKMPRKVFVQGNLEMVEGKPVFKEYEATMEGLIQSVVERGVFDV